MKTIKYILFALVIISCSKDKDENVILEEEGIEEENSNPALTVVDYNPKQTYSYEEVVIEVEELDETATIEIIFNGVTSNNVEIEGNQIKTRVPQQATSGEIIVKYNSEDIAIGSIEITQEMDKLYGGIFVDEFEGDEYFEINLSDGSIGAFFINAIGWDIVGDIIFSKQSNVAYNTHSVQCGSSGCSKDYIFKNWNTGVIAGYTFCTDFDCLTRYLRFKAMGNTQAFYEVYLEYYDVNGVVFYHYLASLDLMTMQVTPLRDYTVEGFLPIPSSVHDEEANELKGFDNNSNKFVRVNLDTFAVSEFVYPNIELKNLILSQTGNLFGILNSNTLVEINPMNGEILDEIFTSDDNFMDLSYSESTGRFFWLNNLTDDSAIHIFNPENGIETVVFAQESINQIFTDY